MSEYMIVPKDSIDDTADAIKTKLGTQNDLTWGQDGFASYVEDIPSGTDYLEQLLGKTITSYTNANLTELKTLRTFQDQTTLLSFSFPNVETITNAAGFCFSGCTGLTSIPASAFPKLKAIRASNIFEKCSNLTVAVLPSVSDVGQNNIFYNCTQLAIADLGSATDTVGSTNIMNQYFFYGCSSLTTVIIRKPVIAKLGNINSFAGTPFASGGTGGTIYIPKSLYDHLGDGGSYDYKAATNWSTVDGYGTITWAKIEGSYYETHYADGTLIPST